MKYHWGPWNAVEGHGTQLRAIEQHWGPWRTLHYSWGLSNIGEVYWFLKFSSSLLVYSRLHVSWFCNFSTTFMLFSSSSSIREILVVKSIQEVPTFLDFWFQRVIMICVDYGNRGCGVFKVGIQNQKGFCIKINIPKGNFWTLRIGLAGSLSSLQKSELLKLIISIFHVKKLNN